MLHPSVALVIGHRPGSPGAVSTGADCAPAGVSEYDFNRALSRMVKAGVSGSIEVEIMSREDTPDGYRELPGRINAAEPSFIVSMHFNAHELERASGTEALYWHGSKAGRDLAFLCQTQFLDVLELHDRGLKPRGWDDRGGYLLGKTAAPCVICEPFFGSNPGDWEVAWNSRGALARAYAQAIENYAEHLTKSVT